MDRRVPPRPRPGGHHRSGARRIRWSSKTSGAAALMPRCFIRKATGFSAILIAATAPWLAASRSTATMNLQPGDIVRIGHCQLAFVHDLTKAFPDSSAVLKEIASRGTTETALDRAGRRQQRAEPKTNRRRSRIAAARRDSSSRPEEVDAATPKVGRAAAQLVPAGLRVGQDHRHQSIARSALASVFEATQVDSGAVLLLPRRPRRKAVGTELEIVASHTDSDFPYHRDLEIPGFHGPARGRSGAGPQRHGRQPLGSRDSTGRNSRHERPLRSDPSRQPRCRA